MAINIPAIIRAIILFIALIICAVGASMPQMKDGNTRYYLSLIAWNNGNGWGNTLKYSVYCSSVDSKMKAAYAFAILACLFFGAGFVLAVLALIADLFIAALKGFVKMFLLGALVTSICCFVFLIISWPIVASVRNEKQCGFATALKDNGTEFADGFGLLIAAWIFAIIDIVVGILTAVLGMFGGSGASVKEAS